jgi:hypothetical protein
MAEGFSFEHMRRMQVTHRFASMAPRLLSLLSLIEAQLKQYEAPGISSGLQRTVSFHKGLARLMFCDGSGSILLQGFSLADGQICVKAMITWTGQTVTGTHSIYPTAQFNWLGAADRVAQMWMEGPASPTPAPAVPSTVENQEKPAEAALEGLAAAG